MRRPTKKNPNIDAKYIIERSKHNISQDDISPKAIEVLKRLNGAGFQAYLVGGGVRDLLIRKAPKDFDIATDATPNQIKKLFRNARIIGRRFKLVHILYHREIIEVATFRGPGNPKKGLRKNENGMLVCDNVYGSLEEDAWRRDLTINSLYYSIKDASIIDYTGGFADIENKKISIIGDAKTRYIEDPVRMLRALRFSAKMNFAMAASAANPITEMSHLIKEVPSSRLFEEIVKLFHCGAAETVIKLLFDYGFFAHLFNSTYEQINSSYPVKSFITIALQNTDRRIQDGKPVTPAFLFAALLWFPVLTEAEKFRKNGIEPLPALDKAMSAVIAAQAKTISIPKRFTQVMREIWLLQHRLINRSGSRAFRLLQHQRFRAAYDFLAIRALAGDADMQLADWWTQFQDASEDEKKAMVKKVTPKTKKSKKRTVK